jgi:hypothetical protein
MLGRLLQVSRLSRSPRPVLGSQFAAAVSVYGYAPEIPDSIRSVSFHCERYRPTPMIISRGHATEHQSSPPSRTISPQLKLQDERLPCFQHLDPTGDILPKSEWIHVNGTLPICSLEEVVQSFETMLQREESDWGIVDLEAPWNPVQDSEVPSLSLKKQQQDQDQDQDHIGEIVQAAHVVISPFGRPNGWLLKFSNRSLVNAILTRAQQDHIHVTWKVVQIEEYTYSRAKELEQDPAHQNGLLVDDSMVRFENCPFGLTEEEIRLRLSRYDLAPVGKTIIEWEGMTNDGKKAPLMYVVRFASPAWARAAVREMQALQVRGKIVKLVQYPNQLRNDDEDDEDDKQEPNVSDDAHEHAAI